MSTNWWPPIIALVVGSVIAVLMLFQRRGATAAAADEELVRLDRVVDGIVEQLRELNAERHLYDAEKFTAEVQRLEREAAAAMRARDAHKSAPKKKPEPKRAAQATGFAAKHPQLVGAIWGGSIVAFFAVSFFFLTNEQKPAAQGDPKYEAVLMLSAIAISFGNSEELLQAWELYMRQPIPRKRPPQLNRAVQWLEKTISE